MPPRDRNGHRMLVGDLVEEAHAAQGRLPRRGMVTRLIGAELDVAIVEIDDPRRPGEPWSGFENHLSRPLMATTGAGWRIVNRF